MASTAEVLVGAMALLVCTFVDIVLYYVGSAILGPIINILNQYKITPLLGLSDNTYVVYVLWAFLLLFEIAAIIAFIFILGRRQVSGVEYV